VIPPRGCGIMAGILPPTGVVRAMPELPDVELFHRLAEERGRGRAIEAAVISDPGSVEGVSAAAFKRRVEGQPIRSTARHGKHLFLVLGEAGAVAMHFGTNGALRFVARGEAEPAYTRLRLDLGQGESLAYVNPRRIGRVSLADSVADFIAAAELGPDALDPALDAARFKAMLRSGKRDVKTVLMDQALIAGIGNIYADEILFQARLHPAIAAASLEPAAAQRLFATLRRTLETAVECEAGAEHGAERVPKSFLLPERHRGGHCPRCGAALATLKQGGRTGYFCPHCQKK
jgi:formamidopyrimidine-DNA glycosylase